MHFCVDTRGQIVGQQYLFDNLVGGIEDKPPQSDKLSLLIHGNLQGARVADIFSLFILIFFLCQNEIFPLLWSSGAFERAVAAIFLGNLIDMVVMQKTEKVFSGLISAPKGIYFHV